MVHAQVDERVGQQGRRHRRGFSQADGLVQERLGLEVLAGAAQGDGEVQQGIDDQARAVAPREAAHVDAHPVQLDRLRELPLRPQVGRVGMHHVVERAPVAELGGLHRLVEVRLGRGHVAFGRRGQGLLQQFERVRRSHDRPTMARRPSPASPGGGLPPLSGRRRPAWRPRRCGRSRNRCAAARRARRSRPGGQGRSRPPSPGPSRRR